MTWVDSGGGPLIAIPSELAPSWRGGEGVKFSLSDLSRWWEKTDLSRSDYGRACAIKDDIGMLDVGSGRALILHGEPMPTAFVPRAQGGVLVRWMCAENEDNIRRAIRSIPRSVWEATPYNIKVARGGILVFDSAYPGDRLPTSLDGMATAPWIRIELPPGTYLIDTADFAPDESTRLILHFLRKKPTKPHNIKPFFPDA